MLSITKSMALQGLNGYLLDVQVDVSNGIPSWEIVGLPDTSLKEAKERVQIAIKNCGVTKLNKKIIINLAPAGLRKEGSSFDLAIAVGVLSSLEYIYQQNLNSTIFLGELSLDGSIKPISGVLPICVEAKKLGIKRIVLPEENSKEASILKGLEIIPVKSLQQTIEYLNGNISILPIQISPFPTFTSSYLLDFSEVKGQENVKRALEISASGGHHCLLIGPPGTRKNNACRKISFYFTFPYF